MSNGTEPELVNTITDSFLNWFQNDILPYFVATFDLITITVGFILNVVLVVTFRKRGLLKEPSSHFVFMLCIADFIAFACVLLPTIITSFARAWILSFPVCYIHGTMITLMLYVSFLFLNLLAVERAVKLTNKELYEKTFELKKFMRILIVVIWLLSAIVAYVTIAGIADVKYDFYHQGCMIDYMTSYILLNAHFITTFGASFIIMIICYSVIFYARRRALKEVRATMSKCSANVMKTRKVAFVKDNNTRAVANDGEIASGSLPLITESKESDVTVEDLEQTERETERKQNTTRQRKLREKSASRQSLLLEVFSDDDENPAFHLAITYLLLWLILVVFYLPYYIVWYYDAYNPGTLWGGFYTLTMIIIHTSFALKPIIYLGHNRHYRAVTKETIPEKVRERVSAVRASVSNAVDKVDDFIFRSPTNRKFVATLAAQKAVLVWKKKLQRIRKKKLPVKDTTDVKTPVVGISIIDVSAEQKSVKLNDSADGKDVNAATDKETKNVTNLRPVPVTVTPSGIEVTSSSFIERERQRLIGNGSTVPPAVIPESTVASSATNDSGSRFAL